MQARIYQPAKVAHQSTNTTHQWRLEFVHSEHKIEDLMNWTSSTNMQDEVILKFSTKEQAIHYAKARNIDYILITHHERIIKPKSYAANFIDKKSN